MLVLLFLLTITITIYQSPSSEEVIFNAVGQIEYKFGENLLIDPGFEETKGWKSYGGGYEIDRKSKHSGDQSLKVTPRDENIRYGAYQGFGLAFKVGEVEKIVIGGWFMNEGGVVGQLYADIYSNDGSETQYGLVVDFDPSISGTWQYNEKTFNIKIRKPFHIVLYVFGVGRQGQPAYFDDISIRKVMTKIDKGYSVFDDTMVSTCTKEEINGTDRTFQLQTKDDFSLTLSNSGTVKSINISGKELSCAEAVPLSGFFVRDAAKNSDFKHLEGTFLSKNGDRTIHQAGELKSLSLEFENTYSASRNRIEISGTIRNLSPQERSITIYFALPLDASGWSFWRDIRTAEIIQGKNSEYRNGGNVGTAGWCSNYPVSTLSKDVSLSYGVRLDQPRIVRMAYNLDNKLYYIAFDLGLSPETIKFPNQAKFSFVIYKSDPKWGFRSAIKKYYDLYPQLFEKRVTKEGIWLVATDILKREKDPQDFGFVFHHSLQDVDLGDQFGIYSCDYFNPKVKVYCLWDAREKPSLEEFEKSLEFDENTLLFQASSSDRKLISNSALYNKNGQPYSSINKVGWFVDKIKGKADKKGWSWCSIFRLNPDPDIPNGSGQWVYKQVIDRSNDYKEKGMTTDGVSFDGVSTGYLNFRREHFKYVDYPLSFDYETKRPVIIDAFSNYECLRYVANKQHNLGKIIMANGFPSDYMFASHLIDSGNAESSKPFSDSRANLARTLLYQKPYSCMLKGDFSTSQGRSKLESYMKKSLFHGIYLTAYNVSGGGEDTNYFEHPEWYNEGRDTFKKYVPLVRRISTAGWEPITYAKSSDTDVYVERYGEFHDNNLYFTLLNNSESLKTIILNIQADELGINNETVIIEDVIKGEKSVCNYDRKKGLLNIKISIAEKDVKLLKILK